MLKRKAPTQLIRQTTVTAVPSKRVRTNPKVVSKGFVRTNPRTIKKEIKRVQSAPFLTSNLLQTGALIQFGVPAAGDASNQRDGRAIEVRGYEYHLTYEPIDLTDYEKLRVIVFLWKRMPDTPIVGDILVNTGIQEFYGTYNVDESSKYTILSDKVYDCNSYGKNVPAASFLRNLASINGTGTAKFTQTFQGVGTSIPTLNDNLMYMLIIPLVGGGRAYQVNATTYIDL